MSPISAASAFLFFLLKSAFQQQALPFRPPERRAANQTGDGVWGVREAHQIGNMKNLMMGQMDTGTLEISGRFLYGHFNFLRERRESLEKISAQLYIFIIHMLIGILNVIASPSNFP